MSLLKELLNKYCPDGVEYKKLGEVCNTITDYVAAGSFKDIAKNVEYIRSPDYAQLVRTTDIKNNFKNNGFVYINEKAFDYLYRVNLDKECIILPNVGINCGEVYYITPQLLPYKNNALAPNAILVRSDNTNNKFLSYIFKEKFFQKQLRKIISNAGQPKFNKTDLKKINIPLPPIEVQKEIVRILDIFTEYQDLLNRELILRKKQYEYYMDKLLTFGDDVEWKELKKVCTDFIVPMRDKPKIFNGNIPWCRIEDVEGKYFNTSLSGRFVSDEIIKKMNLKVFPIGTVICSCSASLGTYAINTQPLITNQTFIGIVCGDKLNNQYLRYYMETQTKKLTSLSNAGTIPYISRQKFENLKIPVPPLKEQERIVKILDRFDTLCNDITRGLPAEIDMRKKQYEYYRDKLLTFKEKKKTKE